MQTTKYVKQEDVLRLIQSAHIDNSVDYEDVKELLSSLAERISTMPVYITNREDDE